MDVGKAIREIRKKQGLSQVELSQKTGLTQATLSNIESGRKRPGPETLDKISVALNIPISLIYITGLEKEDVADDKKFLYDQLFPVIQSLALQIAEK